MNTNERTHLLNVTVSSDGHERDNRCVPCCLISFIIYATAIISSLLLFANQHYDGAVNPKSSFLMPSKMKTMKQQLNTNQNIHPGSIFLDTQGEPINAHGGGFLFHNNTYYWYGEIKTGTTHLPKSNADWGGTRVDLTGISCYSSNDLLNWKNHGNVMPAVAAVANDTTHHDLYRENVAERPKVIYNKLTNKFVMWLHIDSMDYKKAKCGVAFSDHPTGPFVYLKSFRPNNEMARDLTVFVDDDDKAYLFTSSEDNTAIHISQLTDDYLSTTGNYSRIFEGRYMEAPTIFKANATYYFIGSGCTAWKPNAARSAVAESIWGPWEELGNPCQGSSEDVSTTFHSQSTYILPVHSEGIGDGDHFIFAADRWNEKNLSDSRYVWLPLSFDESGHPIMKWRNEWNPIMPSDAWST